MEPMAVVERLVAHPREAVFALACLVLFVVPILFIMNRVYKDGLWGRLALAGISSFAALFLAEIVLGRGYHVELEEVGLVSAFAIFITWHLARFHRRVLRRQKLEQCKRCQEHDRALA